MTKPLLIIDIDGVACDHATGICNRVNLDYNLKSKPENVTTQNHNFGPINFIEAVEKYYPNDSFVLGLGVHIGFKTFIKNVEKKVAVKFATNREHSHKATETWIKQHFGTYNVTFVNDKNSLEFDYLIEDYTGTALKAAQSGRTAFIISRPWNLNDANCALEEECLYYVYTFEEIIPLISQRF